jgi:8-oxo-dGTP diphosphatase
MAIITRRKELALKNAAVIILKNNTCSEILLGAKKTGFGAGKISVIGGKINPGEKPADAVIRELHEETGIQVTPDSLIPAGRLNFNFPVRPDWNFAFEIFISDTWEGLPMESAEVAPCWFKSDQLPLTQMWPDTAIWLPLVLKGYRVYAGFTYNNDNETLSSGEIRFL